MLFKVEKNYLVLPVSSHAKMKNVSFYNADGICVFAVNLRLDALTPQYDAYVDIRRFKGESLEVSVNPEIAFSLKARDRMPVCRFREKARPKYHFTAPEGLFGDVSALLYTGGAYHLFYNLNPAGKEKENFHTAHAVSRNLVDWDYCAPVLFLDKNGAVVSCSASLDEKNLLGAKTCEKVPAVMFYIYENKSGDSMKSVQSAVSDNGCESFSKLISGVNFTGEENIKNLHTVYSTKYDKYVSIADTGDGKYALFTSKNLRDFEKCQELSFDAVKCPSFFPLSYGEYAEKWALFGEDGRYIIGEFDAERFNADFSQAQTFNYSSAYATHARFLEVCAGRVLRFATFDGDFSYPDNHYCGVMTFPQEIRLVKTDKGDTVCVNPAREIEKLHGKKIKKSVTGKENLFTLRGIAQDISITVSPLSAKHILISVFGIQIELDAEKQAVRCGEHFCPVHTDDDGKIELRILTDTCGFEIYAGHGESYMAISEMPDANLCVLSLTSDSEILARVCAVRLRDSRKSDKRR